MANIEKIVIIGGGPAGLATAIYNSRANLKPLMFGGAPYGGQLMLTSDVENYPGFDSVLGPDLIEKMRVHAKKFGTNILDKNITKVDFTKKPFELYSSDEKYFSNAVIITTGAKAIWLGLESETRLRGKGVSACATCDGFFFKDKIVGVVGGGDSAMEEALFLTKFASKIYILHRRDEFRASQIMQDRVKNHPKIEILWNTEIDEVLGENKVEGIKLTGTRQLKVDGLFIAIGHKPDTDVFKGQIELDEKGYIVTSQVEALRRVSGLTSKKNYDFKYQTMTSVAGVFAGGDCVDHAYRQAGTAVGMGIAAALEAERWLDLNSKP